MSDFVSVGKKADFKDLSLTGVNVGGEAICVARAGETFYSFDDRCTHAHATCFCRLSHRAKPRDALGD